MGADLHLHSTYSDGSFSPEELVKMAQEKNISTIAIADHDTVEGTAEAIKAGWEYDIEVIPALEFSTYWGKAEIHILGYEIDYEQKDLLEKINEIFEARKDRAQKMISLLQKQGVEISFKQVKDLAGDKYIGRPHIARSLIKKGYINEIGEAFSEQYIGNGGQAYVPKYKLEPAEAIQLIKKAGGIPVLAHPVFINHGQPLRRKEILELVDVGLEGVEVFHSKHTKSDSQYYKKLAEEFDLLITGGTDFHGENNPGVKIGDIILEDEYVKELKS